MENKSSKNKSSLSNLKTYYFLENINHLNKIFPKINLKFYSNVTTHN